MDILKYAQGIPLKIASTGVVSAEPSNLIGLLLKHDGVNDPTFTLYNDPAAATGGYEICGGTWKDSELPIGFVGVKWRMSRGIYIAIANIGSGYFTVVYNTKFVLQRGV